MYPWWGLCTLYFTRMPGESYRRRLRSSLLYLSYVFQALINSLVCWFCTSALGLLFEIIWGPFSPTESLSAGIYVRLQAKNRRCGSVWVSSVFGAICCCCFFGLNCCLWCLLLWFDAKRWGNNYLLNAFESACLASEIAFIWAEWPIGYFRGLLQFGFLRKMTVMLLSVVCV